MTISLKTFYSWRGVSCLPHTQKPVDSQKTRVQKNTKQTKSRISPLLLIPCLKSKNYIDGKELFQLSPIGVQVQETFSVFSLSSICCITVLVRIQRSASKTKYSALELGAHQDALSLA